MAAAEAAFSFLSSSSSSSKCTYPLIPEPSPSVNYQYLPCTHILSLTTPLLSSFKLSRKSRFKVRTAAQEQIEVEEESHNAQLSQRKKLFVLNFPWSLTVVDLKNLFSECGTVSHIEMIKQKNGKSRGFAFVTMASGEEAQAVIEKFDSYELSGRIIKIEYAKGITRPSPPPAVSTPRRETDHKLYVSNLAWKVRASDLRELFAANFKPVSPKVVLDNSSGKSAGYGFVSFATREEAETAISELNGKELLGRPISLKFSQRSVDEAESKEESSFEETPQA